MTHTLKPSGHLANILDATRQHHPNFTVFLGAGASVESGISSGAKLIEGWQAEFTKLYGQLDKQPWHNTPLEYATLFETLYDHPSQRREFIEQCLIDGNPSWGYIYLVDLLQNNVFNTVLTTNFDDLLNEACYQFSSQVRPIVCAHDSSIRTLRVTSKRPKIVKLHGDFLFDSIKNTIRELESLEDNMREKFRQFAREYGMIVIGYGGADRSIMDTLDSLLRSEDNFPHGVYWCVRSGNDILPTVDALTRFPKFNLVEISGFDAFMVELHDKLVGQLPLVSNPYDVVASRFQSLVGNLRISLEGSGALHPLLERDASRLCAELESQKNLTLDLPFKLLAWSAKRNGDVDSAKEHIIRHLKNLKVPDTESQILCVELLIDSWDQTFFEEMTSESVRLSSNAKELTSTLNPTVAFLNAKKFDAASSFMKEFEQVLSVAPEWQRQYFQLNQLQTVLHLGDLLSEKQLKLASEIARNPSDPGAKFGALCVLGRHDEALNQLESVNMPKQVLLDWPIASLIPQEKQARFLGESVTHTADQPDAPPLGDNNGTPADVGIVQQPPDHPVEISLGDVRKNTSVTAMRNAAVTPDPDSSVAKTAKKKETGRR